MSRSLQLAGNGGVGGMGRGGGGVRGAGQGLAALRCGQGRAGQGRQMGLPMQQKWPRGPVGLGSNPAPSCFAASLRTVRHRLSELCFSHL